MTEHKRPGVLSERLLDEASATEVWSTGGERFGIRDGAAAVVIEETRWHASTAARTGIALNAQCTSERAALVNLRNKLVGAMQAIDARLGELARGGE